MKTKDDLILYVVNAHVCAGMKTDAEKQTGYGDRFLKASKIILTGGVTATSRGEYEVHSGTDANIMYHVNGTCECQDWKNWLHHERWLKDQQGKDVTSFAPRGFCKHRLAVVIWGKVQAKLKWTAEQNIPHPHRWGCEAHRAVPVECWQHACPDPESIPCPTCQRDANVTPEIAQIIQEEGAPVREYIAEPDAPAVDMETGEILDEPTPANEQPPSDQPEPATAIHSTTSVLPEAAASLNIKVRMDNTELMYTMRGHTDAEVLERLPNVLATIERLLKSDVDHEASFLQRLARAFFPRKS